MSTSTSNPYHDLRNRVMNSGAAGDIWIDDYGTERTMTAKEYAMAVAQHQAIQQSQAANAANSLGNSWSAIAYPTSPGVAQQNAAIKTRKWDITAMLKMRLNIAGHENPFKHFLCVEDGEKVFVFIVHEGKAVTMEDEIGLYPSDGLVTKVRLLLP